MVLHSFEVLSLLQDFLHFLTLQRSSQATRSDQCPSQSCPSFLAFSVTHEDYQWFEVQYGTNLTSQKVFCARENIFKYPASKVQYVYSIFNVQILNFLLITFSFVLQNVSLKNERLHAKTSYEDIINFQWTQPGIS